MSFGSNDDEIPIIFSQVVLRLDCRKKLPGIRMNCHQEVPSAIQSNVKNRKFSP